MKEERVKACPYCHNTIPFKAARCPDCKKTMPKKILIVENKKRSQQWIRTRVGGVNIEVEKAMTGKEAIEKASVKEYAAILIDLELSDMAGEEVAEQMIANGVTAPLIGSYKGKPAPDPVKLSESGFVTLMKKPLSKENLKKVLTMAMTITSS